MTRSPFSVLALAACCLLPAAALELQDLRLPLTRTEADRALSRDYQFRVLEDMTVRRSWALPNRTVSVDFSPKEGDKALLIFVTYTRPVTPAECGEDAAKLLGMEPSRWQPVNEKRALRLGMEAAEGFKLAGDRYCFRELDEQGNVQRLVYYAGMPSRVVRWELADDAREEGKTALGHRAVRGSSDFLWKDEERRRGVSAQSSADTLASAAAAVVADGGSAAEAPAPQPMMERPKERKDLVEMAVDYVKNMTPTHYAIIGGVLLLLLLRALLKARAARRRALVTNYIMNQGKNKGNGRR